MKGTKLQEKHIRESLYDFVFIGPAFVIFVCFVLLPFLMSIGLSFTLWDGQSAPRWVGLQNCAIIFKGEDAFAQYLTFTVKYAVVYVLLVNLTGLGLALILTQERVRFRNGIRTMVILPYMVSGLVLGFIWQFIFNKVFPMAGMKMGIKALEVSWLGSSNMAYWALILVSVWQMAGYVMFIYIAAILNIPSELVESAKMDGGKSYQIFRYIKFPMIMPSVTVGLFYAANIAFKVFDVNFSLTGGGPANSTTSVAMDIYYEAFSRGNQGLGCAKSAIFFIVVALLTLSQLKLTQNKEVQL